jgi:PAS domain S-box-containing protein
LTRTPPLSYKKDRNIEHFKDDHLFTQKDATRMKQACCLVMTFLTVFLFSSSSPAAGARPEKRVLLLNSEGLDNQGQKLAGQGLWAVLSENRDFDIHLYVEFLDASRFGNAAHARALADFLARKYAAIPIDVIITIYPWALDFLAPRRQTLFPDVPVVAAVIPRGYAAMLENTPARHYATGTIVGQKITELMDDVRRLRPQTRRVALIAGTSDSDRHAEMAYRQALMEHEPETDLIDLTSLSMAETLERAGSLSRDTVVLYSSIFKDAAGEDFLPCAALSLIAGASSVPVFGVLETYLGNGIVGGRILSFTTHGKLAGSMAVRILGGQSPESIPFQGDDAYISAYDWRELKRWNLSEKDVAPGSEIRFRVPSFWETHQTAIIGMISLVLVETLLVLGLLVNIFKRRKAEQSLVENEERLSLAADSAGAGLWSLNLADGHYWLTDKTREIYGFYPDEAITHDRFLTSIHPEDRDTVRRKIEKVLESQEGGRIEYRIPGANDTVRWIASHGHVHCKTPGICDRLTGVSIDITDHKRMETALRSQLEEIENLTQQLEKENIYLRREIVYPFSQDTIVGRSSLVQKVLAAADQVAQTDSTVLITGETGTGKELLSHFIHNQSKRRDRIMVRVNCGALPANLIENELFGREKGAYTGALSREAGRFELADGSTLFLDEIGELSADLQAKLLHFLESGEFERLGSTKTIRVDVRVIAATHRNLAEEVKKGTFREDLFYRLNVFPIEVPPLRQRPEDIPLLVKVFIREFNQKMGKQVQSISKKAMQQLEAYAWPGNIRELRNVIEHAVILSQGEILNLEMPKKPIETPETVSSLEEVEKQHILSVLKQTGWRIKGADGAAERLKIKPSTLYSKMARLGIATPRQKERP